MVLQRLVLLLLGLLAHRSLSEGGLRETRRAGRMAGEQLLDDCARLHAGAESIKRFAANAIHETAESYS